MFNVRCDITYILKQLAVRNKLWLALMDDQLIGPFVLERRLIADYYLHFLNDKLPLLLENVPHQARLNM
jgi:hypothetical protein